MDEYVSYLGKTQSRNAWKRKGTTQKTWQNYIFFTELKKQDGEAYEPNSLCSMQASTDGYLRERGYTYSILKSREFASSKAVLEGKARVIREDTKRRSRNESSSLVLSS